MSNLFDLFLSLSLSLFHCLDFLNFSHLPSHFTLIQWKILAEMLTDLVKSLHAKLTSEKNPFFVAFLIFITFIWILKLNPCSMLPPFFMFSYFSSSNFSNSLSFYLPFYISGVSALYLQIEKKESQNHIENVEAIHHHQEQQTAVEVARHTQSLRTIEMRLAMNNDIMGDEDLLNYPNLTSILGRDLSLYHRWDDNWFCHKILNFYTFKEWVAGIS